MQAGQEKPRIPIFSSLPSLEPALDPDCSFILSMDSLLMLMPIGIQGFSHLVNNIPPLKLAFG